MKTIPLTRGLFTTVNEKDYEMLSRNSWTAVWAEDSKSFYAARQVKVGPNRWSYVFMHRVILGLGFGDPRIGDHRNPNETLNNTRGNLRIVTIAQNCMNSRRSKNNTTGYKGVSKRKDTGKYRAYIVFDWKQINLGSSFNTAEEAYAAYCDASKRYHGEFGRVE